MAISSQSRTRRDAVIPPRSHRLKATLHSLFVAGSLGLEIARLEVEMQRYRWISEELPSPSPGLGANISTARSLFDYPADAFNDRAGGNRPKAVCIVGGGIAGLTAAYELSRPSPQGWSHEVVL